MRAFLKSRAVKLLAIGVLLATTLGVFSGTTISITSPLTRNTIDLRVGFVRIAMASGNMDYPLTQAGVQSALNALPVTGGRINLMATSATLTFAGTVSRAIPNVTIQGTGNVPLIQNNGVTPLFSVGGQTGWVFRDLSTDAGGITLNSDTVLDNVHLGTTYYANASTGTANYSAVTDSGLTSGRIPIVGASGLLVDSANLAVNAQNSLSTGKNAIIVASQNEPATIKNQADYVTDGVADDVQINAAIASLSAGRTWQETVKVIGAMSITNSIVLASYTRLDLTNAKITAGANVKVLNLENPLVYVDIIGGILDGNKGAGYNSHVISIASGITSYINIVGTEIKNAGNNGINSFLTHYLTLSGVYIHDSTTDGFNSNRGNHIWIDSKSHFDSNGRYGAEIHNDGGSGVEAHDIWIDDSQANLNAVDGFYLSDNGPTQGYNFNVSNTITNNNTANDGLLIVRMKDGNIVNHIGNGNGGDGLVIDSSNGVSASGVVAHDNRGRGVYLTNATDTALGNKNHTLVGISAYNNDQSAGTIPGIDLNNTTNTTISSSVSVNKGGTTQDYGIAETGTISDNNTIIGNEVAGNTVANIVILGANTIVRSNIGYVTEKSGTFSITAGLWGVSVNHGLSTNATSVQLTLTSNATAIPYILAPIMTTAFSVNLTALQGSDITGYWRAVTRSGN